MKLPVAACGAVLLLLSTAVIAAANCSCGGRGTVFANHARDAGYIDIRVDRITACEKACDMVPGAVRRVYLFRGPVRDRPVQRYFSNSRRYLADKAPGYHFDFHYSVSGKGGTVIEVWSIDPK